MATAKPEQKCVIQQCAETKITARGLCLDCYLAALYQVRVRKATWEQLESLGLAKPKRQVKHSAFCYAFEAATKSPNGQP
jgi:hypothetical protein